MELSKIDWVTNNTASAYLTSTTNSFIYTLAPSLKDPRPDFMIVRQVTVSLTPQTSTTSILPFNISCDVTNQTFAMVSFPYNDSTTDELSVFISNPQTIIKIERPISNTITFTMSPVNPAVVTPPSSYVVSLCFDLIKLKKN